MECPYCNTELIEHDSFGFFSQSQSGKKLGTIYKCGNESCEGYGQHFYAYEDQELKEGYPC